MYTVITQEQLWLCAEAVGACAANTAHFYIREDRLSFALLVDPTMTHRPKNDYYITMTALVYA